MAPSFKVFVSTPSFHSYVGGVLDYMVTKYVFSLCQLDEITSYIQYSQLPNRMYVAKFVHVAHLVYTICRTQASGGGPKIPTT